MAGRWWLMLAALPALALAQQAGRGLSNYSTQPAAEPFHETVFGTAIDDPYRWMERADRRAELAAWVNASSLRTTTELAALPGRAGLLAEMEAASRAADTVADDRPLLGAGVPANGFTVEPVQFPIVSVDPTTRWSVAVATNARAENPLAFGTLADVRAGTPRWTPLAGYDDRVNGADVIGDTLYYLTSRTDPKGELRALTLGPGATLARSRSVMRSDGRVLTSMVTTASGVYVQTTLPSAASELWFVPIAGGAARRVALPADLAIDDVAVSPDRRSVTFLMSGYTQANTYYRAVAGRAAPLGLANTTLPAARTRTVTQETALSADGTRVPLTIVSIGPRHGPAPTVVDAYGAYGVSGAPGYGTSWLVWNQRGGVYSYCHIRGGGELGEGWHRAGMLADKVNAHAD